MLLWTVLIVAGVGCAGEESAPLPDESVLPFAHGADRGLEIRWWVVNERAGSIGPLLAAYRDRPVPLPPEVRHAWSANGLRLVAVPIDDLPSLHEAMPLVGTVSRQWLGERSTWTRAGRGQRVPGGGAIALDSGMLWLGAGRLGLLVRDWIVPRVDESGAMAAALEVELVPRFEQPSRSTWRLEPKIPGAGAEDQGLVFDRLLARMVLPGTDAILVLPEAPGVVWRAGPSADEVEQMDRRSSASSEESPVLVGPPAPEVPTLGEAMFGSTGRFGREASPRAILLLVPRVPEQYRLIGG